MKSATEEKVLEKRHHRVAAVPGVIDPVEGPDDRAAEGECNAERVGEVQAKERSPGRDDHHAHIAHHHGRDFPAGDFLFSRGIDSRVRVIAQV